MSCGACGGRGAEGGCRYCNKWLPSGSAYAAAKDADEAWLRDKEAGRPVGPRMQYGYYPHEPKPVASQIAEYWPYTDLAPPRRGGES